MKRSGYYYASIRLSSSIVKATVDMLLPVNVKVLQRRWDVLIEPEKKYAFA